MPLALRCVYFSVAKPCVQVARMPSALRCACVYLSVAKPSVQVASPFLTAAMCVSFSRQAMRASSENAFSAAMCMCVFFSRQAKCASSKPYLTAAMCALSDVSLCASSEGAF